MHLRGMLPPQIFMSSMSGYLSWSFKISDVMVAALPGSGQMAVPKVDLIDFWCLIHGCVCGPILLSMSSIEISLITAQSF